MPKSLILTLMETPAAQITCSNEDVNSALIALARLLGRQAAKELVELIGGLAAILQLTISGHKKTAIQEDSGICRVLMVAGVGFEPTTFRL